MILKSTRNAWAGHIARMGDEKLFQMFGPEIRRDQLEGLGIGDRIILKWVLRI
jgi:hypothetical protein